MSDSIQTKTRRSFVGELLALASSALVAAGTLLETGRAAAQSERGPIAVKYGVRERPPEDKKKDRKAKKRKSDKKEKKPPVGGVAPKYGPPAPTPKYGRPVPPR